MKKLIIILLSISNCIKITNSLNILNKNMNSKLIKASLKGDLDKIKKLLEKGANVNDKNNDGWKETALICASMRGYEEIAKLLINKGANVNDKDEYGNTPLIIASIFRYIEVVRLLIEAGANVNEKNNKGATALMIASIGGYKEVVELLIEKGANVNDKHNDNRTTALIAVSNKLREENTNNEKKYKYIDIAYILIKEMKHQLEKLNIYPISTSYEEKATKKSKNMSTNKELNKYIGESMELFDFLLSYKNENFPLYKKLPKELFIHIIKFIN